MKALAILALALGAFPQDEGKRKVEGPLRAALESSSPAKFDLAKTGIAWHKGLDAVLHREKPILLLQLLGNYDEVFC